MTALTVRLPDEKLRRLKALARSRGTPLNRLIDEMTTLMLSLIRKHDFECVQSAGLEKPSGD